MFGRVQGHTDPGVGRRRRAIRWLIVIIGMIVGGEIQNAARVALPGGAAKQVLTSGILAWQSPPATTWNIFFGTIALGPMAIDVSVIGLAGALLTTWLLLKLFD